MRGDVVRGEGRGGGEGGGGGGCCGTGVACALVG